MKKLNTEKFLESLKSIKLPNSLTSFKLKSLKLPKSPESSDSIKLDKTKTAKAASSVVLFGFSGWFLWQTFMAVPEPTLPPSSPPTVATMTPAPMVQTPAPVDEPIETAEDLMVTESEEFIDAAEELLIAAETPEISEEVNEIPNQAIENTEQEPMEALALGTEQLEPDALHETTVSYDDEPTTEITVLASTPASDETPPAAHPYTLTARSNLDARDCLTLTENMDIHRCAENFR